jgi:hypothetical protein
MQKKTFKKITKFTDIPRVGFPSADIFVVQTGTYVRDGFLENKREWMYFLL